ncbi:Uncharacterised protein [uncultured Clostridium sp.]|uniref:hypothetical protein n=1 Tax=uncultured Clostridium sp. TaxID=59620 RepID=UPI000821FF4F|nr:hypothetical protein [uncultured Clostridium sp.]SCJ89626.1 Uncharacterised protein [uncultured Clostridium sp.]
MDGFLGKSYRNSLKGNLKEAVNGGKVIISIVINNKRFPSKLYSRSSWVIELSDIEIKVINERKKEMARELLITDIDKVSINVSKGFNNAPGPYMTQTICCEIAVNIRENEYYFICEDLKVIPVLLKWMKENKINYIDSYNLEELYNSKEEKEVIEILYNNIKEITDR